MKEVVAKRHRHSIRPDPTPDQEDVIGLRGDNVRFGCNQEVHEARRTAFEIHFRALRLRRLLYNLECDVGSMRRRLQQKWVHMWPTLVYRGRRTWGGVGDEIHVGNQNGPPTSTTACSSWRWSWKTCLCFQSVLVLIFYNAFVPFVISLY